MEDLCYLRSVECSLHANGVFLLPGNQGHRAGGHPAAVCQGRVHWRCFHVQGRANRPATAARARNPGRQQGGGGRSAVGGCPLEDQLLCASGFRYSVAWSGCWVIFIGRVRLRVSQGCETYSVIHQIAVFRGTMDSAVVPVVVVEQVS